jgi:hypothetical protein
MFSALENTYYFKCVLHTMSSFNAEETLSLLTDVQSTFKGCSCSRIAWAKKRLKEQCLFIVCPLLET